MTYLRLAADYAVVTNSNTLFVRSNPDNTATEIKTRITLVEGH